MLSVADLERQLADAKAEAEKAAREAAARAKETAAQQRRVATSARSRLVELEAELTAALAQPPEDDRGYLLTLRGQARSWLHGGVTEGPASRSLELFELCDRDPYAGRLHQLHLAFSPVMVELGGAGLAEGDELLTRADDVECRCWRALMARVRFLAGED